MKRNLQHPVTACHSVSNGSITKRSTVVSW